MQYIDLENEMKIIKLLLVFTLNLSYMTNIIIGKYAGPKKILSWRNVNVTSIEIKVTEPVHYVFQSIKYSRSNVISFDLIWFKKRFIVTFMKAFTWGLFRTSLGRVWELKNRWT